MDMNFFYYYEIAYYIESERRIAKGLTYGKSWVDVINHIIEYYGDDEMVEILYMSVIGDGADVVEMADINECIEAHEKEGKR